MAARIQSAGTGGEGDPLAARLVSIPEFAGIADVSPEWVRLRVREGFIPKTERGRLNLVEATQGYCRYMRDLATRAEERAADPMRDRYLKARAEEVEFRNARAMHDLIGWEEATEAMAYMVVLAEPELRRLVTALPRDVRAAALASIEEAVDRIKERQSLLSEALKTGDFKPVGGKP